MKKELIFGMVILGFLVSCHVEDEKPFASLLEEGEELSGGATTVHDESVNAFGHAAPNLTGDKEKPVCFDSR